MDDGSKADPDRDRLPASKPASKATSKSASNDSKEPAAIEADPITVIVTLSDEACDDLVSVTQRLEKAGLVVEEVLEFLGQVIGKWSHAELTPLLEIEGVDDVSESHEFQLAPPGSLIQ